MSSVRPSKSFRAHSQPTRGPRPNFVRQQIPAYGLRQTDLIEWLMQSFPALHVDEFSLHVRSDFYTFNVPRHLTQEETSSLREKALRVQDEGYIEDEDFESSEERRSDAVAAEKDAIDPVSTWLSTTIPALQMTPSGRYQLPTSSDISSKLNMTIDFDYDPENTENLGYTRASLVAQGFSSKVYECKVVNRYWYKQQGVLDQKTTTKLAIKRLDADTSAAHIRREYEALKQLSKTQRQHRNIVELISVFRHGDADAIRYNLCFPLATCNMKQMFEDHNDTRGLDRYRRYLWSQFEGLTAGLRFIHKECSLAHTDLKPSNILVYVGSGANTQDPEPIVCRIADFGLAVNLQNTSTWNLGSKEAASAIQYDGPEIRQYVQQQKAAGSPLKPTSVQLMRADVWKLAAIFTELLTYLLGFVPAVYEFRKFITVTEGGISSETIEQLRFDDGVSVKPQVLEWLRKISIPTGIIEELYNIIVGMFADALERPDATQVYEQFMKSSWCPRFDGSRVIFVTEPKNAEDDRTVNSFSQLLSRASQSLRNGNGWTPLRLDWRYPRYVSRLRWIYGNTELFVDVPSDKASVFKARYSPLSLMWANNQAHLPLYNATSAGGMSNIGGGAQATSHPGAIQMSTVNNWGGATTLPGQPQQVQAPAGAATAMELYWCVDKPWSEPRDISLCVINDDSAQPLDDRSLLDKLREQYYSTYKWRYRVLSWSMPLGVEFIHFSVATASKDRVYRIAQGIPRDSNPPHAPYPDWTYVVTNTDEIHMAIAAKQLIYGFHNHASISTSLTDTICMIPKLKNLPLDNRVGTQAWGIRPVHEFSRRKFVYWWSVITVLGVVFVICWLSRVDAKDLQNATIPMTVLLAFLTIGMGTVTFARRNE